ncbi:unnamed protein product [Dovyalis caffra]|uniref:Uncharacterized protein n=1 Tax=Dovyalis caffra TaxID=77055 RepID=A0AAV1QPT1_9ROSI|nr:unnamed protein product [Dovyalis caffra]
MIDGTPIRELPDLPPSLHSLTACDYASLETISIVNLSQSLIDLNFSNCFKLDQRSLSADMHLKIQSAKIKNWGIQMFLPEIEIPERMEDKGVKSSVTIQFPSNCQQLKGLGFCLVFSLPLNILSDHFFHPFIDEDPVAVYIGCHVQSKNDEHNDVIFITQGITLKKPYDSDHMFLKYQPIVCENPLIQYPSNKVTFEFLPIVESYYSMRTKQQLGEIQKFCKFKRC